MNLDEVGLMVRGFLQEQVHPSIVDKVVLFPDVRRGGGGERERPSGHYRQVFVDCWQSKSDCRERGISKFKKRLRSRF